MYLAIILSLPLIASAAKVCEYCRIRNVTDPPDGCKSPIQESDCFRFKGNDPTMPTYCITKLTTLPSGRLSFEKNCIRKEMLTLTTKKEAGSHCGSFKEAGNEVEYCSCEGNKCNIGSLEDLRKRNKEAETSTANVNFPSIFTVSFVLSLFTFFLRL